MDYDYLESKVNKLSIEINELNIYILQSKKLTSLKQNSSIIISDKEEEKTQSNKLIIDDDKIKSKSWAEITDEDDESLFKKYKQLNKDIKELRLDIESIKKINKTDCKSKLIRFEFINNIVTWEMQEKHELNGIIKMIINPVYGNTEVYQIFFYNIQRNLLGFKNSREYTWFKIDFSQKLLQYPDNNGQMRFVYYNFVNIEKEKN